MSRYQHGYSWPFLTAPPYRPMLSADPPGYIPSHNKAAVYSFEPDALRLVVHVKGSIEVHRLWARPYFSSSVPHIWFI